MSADNQMNDRVRNEYLDLLGEINELVNQEYKMINIGAIPVMDSDDPRYSTRTLAHKIRNIAVRFSDCDE